MMATTNITGNGTQTKTFEGLVSVDVFQSISFSAVNILLSITATLGKSILLSLLPFIRNLPSIRHPNSCIVVWQQLIFWLVLLPSLSMLLIGFPWFTNTGVFFGTQGTQSSYQAMHYAQCLCRR